MIQGLSKEKECRKRKRKKDISSDDSLNTSEEEETSHSKVSLLIIIIDLIYTCMFQTKERNISTGDTTLQNGNFQF